MRPVPRRGRGLAVGCTLADPRPDVCVLGGGVSGLTTAAVLSLLGYRVHLAAKDLIGGPGRRPERPDPAFASMYPAASIIPRSVVIADLAWHIETSLRFCAALQFAAIAGVRRQRHFELFESPVDVPEYAGHLPAFAPVPPGASPGPEVPRRAGADGVSGWTFECFFAEMPQYEQWLRRAVAALGGHMVRCSHLEPRDLPGLPAPVIVNCTGYGSGTLFGDEANLVLVRGVLVHVLVDRRHPAGQRAPLFSYNYTPDRSVYPAPSGEAADVYWYPRVDSWVLGGTRLSGRLDRWGRWSGEEPAGPTVDIDGVAVPAAGPRPESGADPIGHRRGHRALAAGRDRWLPVRPDAGERRRPPGARHHGRQADCSQLRSRRGRRGPGVELRGAGRPDHRG